MELLILKSGDEYVRFKDDRYLLVKLEKASVFPFDQLDVVRQHEARLVEDGFMAVCVKKLILTEEDL